MDMENNLHRRPLATIGANSIQGFARKKGQTDSRTNLWQTKHSAVRGRGTALWDTRGALAAWKNTTLHHKEFVGFKTCVSGHKCSW